MRITNIYGAIEPERLAAMANAHLTKRERIDLGLILLKLSKKSLEDGHFKGLAYKLSQNLKV